MVVHPLDVVVGADELAGRTVQEGNHFTELLQRQHGQGVLPSQLLFLAMPEPDSIVAHRSELLAVGAAWWRRLHAG
jgi:hypothetical protein